MAEQEVSPFGSWRSPITADLIVASSVRFGHLATDGDDIYWTEGRPQEGGRNVIVRWSGGDVVDLTPPGYSARTMVHEYGGGEFAVSRGTVFFANFADQRLYRQAAGSTPVPITPEAPLRYADLLVDATRRRVICVCEDHSDPAGAARNSIVAVAVDGAAAPRMLLEGRDFYAYPRLSEDGQHLAWLTWQLPNMPWDGSEVWVAEVAPDGGIEQPRLVAGGPEESIFQPTWSPDGTLYFVSDRTGWWNIYRWAAGETEVVASLQAEFGMPQWAFGMATFGFQSAERIIAAFTRGGRWGLARIDAGTGALSPIPLPYSDIRVARVTPREVLLIAGSPSEPLSVVSVDLGAGGDSGAFMTGGWPPSDAGTPTATGLPYEVLRRSTSAQVDPSYVSSPEPIAFPTEGGLTAYGLYYPPRNAGFRAPAGERPPLMVLSHGGPTGAAATALNLTLQYWTSRGFALIDVNYGGSTGYGRPYRERLDGRWGVVDVDDCVNGARYLVARDEVDPNRLIIAGGSAGGYTTLCALTFRDTFKAGASYFGIGDLTVFVGDTHKFESRYLDRLVGPYPEARDRYLARSPINYADRLSCPVILFQGLDDKIVPPNQAELLAAALSAKGLPFAYVPFAGEGHGFRRAETIKRALEAELYFYSRIFGFALAEAVAPVAIENLGDEKEGKGRDH